MKNLTKIFMAVVALFAVSCVTDTTGDLAPELGLGAAGQTELTLSLEESRTQLGDFDEAAQLYALTWSEGDKISVNGIESSEAQIDAENSALANFIVSGIQAPYCIAYPAAPAGKVKFKADQNHNNGKSSFEDGVAVMYGYGKSGLGLALKHLTGVLKIGIKGAATLSHAQISTADRAPIAGTFDLDFESGKLTADTTTEVINYSFGENGLALTEEPQYIYVAVPAGEYDELYVTLYEQGNSGNIMYVTIGAGEKKPLTAGNVREFNSSILYSPNATGHVVYDYTTLCAFAEAVKSATEDAPFTKEVIFTDDVIIPAASEENPTPWTSIEGYTGIIHGNGYAIEGLTTPLFGTTSATIKGLHLRGVNIVETEQGVVGAFARVYTGQMSHCSTSGALQINNTTYNEAFTDGEIHHINIGGLVGRTEGATISDSVNGINVTITSVASAESTNAYQTIAGGCIGLANLGTTLSGLTNNGVVSYEAATSPTGSLFISGVLGRAGASEEPIGLLSIKNCTNNGKVTAVESSVRKGLLVLSGVIGVSTQATVCDQLHNTAEISDYATTEYSKNKTYIAGVAGYYIFNSASNFSNSGAIKSYGQKYALYLGGVAGHWDSSNKSAFIHDNFDNSGAIELGGNHTNNVFIGGVFAYPQKSPQKHNCDNSGDITISGPVGGQLKCGGLLSTQWGQYTNGVYKCTNSGKIHITSTAVLTDTAHIGGLTGNGNNSTGTRYKNIVECYNTGELLFEGTANKNLYIGGLTGSQSTGAWYVDCYNTGKITVKETSSAGTNNVGGLLGGVYGSATQQSEFNDCYNEGAIEVVSAGDATGNLFVGGIAGRSTKDTNPHQFTLSGCENRATISVSGALSGAADAAAYIGGMLGYFVDESKTLTITNCSTTTAATISVAPSSSKIVYVGGILGASEGTANLTGNTNNAAINATGTYGSTYNLGGIAGGHIGSLVHTQKSSTNNGAITGNPTSATACIIGGLVGNCAGTLVLGSETATEGCKNNAKLTEKGTHNTGNNVYVGGFIAYGSATATCINCENTTNGIIECTPVQGNRIIASGGYGYLYSKATANTSINMTKCYNKAAVNVTVTDKFSNRTFVGGLVAFNELGTGYALLTDCENQGNITIGGTSKNQNIQAAGVYGSNYGSGTPSKLTNCYNKGEVVISTTNINNLHLGGMVGCAAGGKAIITNCHNQKKIEFTGSANADMGIGGIAGYTSGYHKIDGCSNSGEVLFSGSTAGNCRIAGVFGYMGATGSHILNCENQNKVTVTGDVPGSKYTAIGGIFGGVQSCIVEGCTNTADGIISASKDAECTKMIIGGIGGMTNDNHAVSLTNCSNAGMVSTACAATDYTKVGGVLAWFYEKNTKELIDDIEAVDAEGASAPTKVSVTSTLSRVKNTGDVSVENATANVVVGGIVGTTAIPVSQAYAYCDVQAPAGANRGWIMGTARTSAITATNCGLGATPAKKWDDENQTWVDEGDGLFDGTNFMDYIYGGTTDWTGVENYDGCQHLTSAEDIPELKPAAPESGEGNEGTETPEA